MNNPDCFFAVAFSSSGCVCATTSADYDYCVKMARYYRNVCKYPSARVLTPDQLDAVLDEERENFFRRNYDT